MLYVRMSDASRIFISYSHKDRERADFLFDGLKGLGHEVFIDREGIFEAENITDRIREMVQASDVVVFVLGPNWITSPACRQEMHFSLELNKRILPAAFEDVGADLPSAIREINYVRFYGQDGDWDSALGRLDDALGRDITWVRDHTRYGDLANRWVRGQVGTLWGRELRAMRSWIERHPSGAPSPSTEHWLYLKAGLRRRKWTQIGSTILGTLATVVGLLFGLNYLSNSQCDEFYRRAELARSLEPVLAIRTLLPLSEFTLCNADRAWLDVLETLGDTVERQRLRATITLPEIAAHFVEFMPETGHVVAATLDGSTVEFDPDTGALTESTLEMPSSSPAPLVINDNGRFVMIRDTRVTVWNPADGSWAGLRYSGAHPILAAALSDEGDTLVVATADNQLYFHSMLSGRSVRDPIDLGQDGSVTELAFVPNSPRLVAVLDNAVMVVDMVPALGGRGPDMLHRLSELPEPIIAMDVSLDGSTVAMAGRTTAAIWDLTTLTEVLPPTVLNQDDIFISSIGLSPDGLSLAVGASDKRARIHDTATGKVLTTLRGHRSPVEGVQFSPSGDVLMTFDQAGHMRIFDISTWQFHRDIPGGSALEVQQESQARQNLSAGRIETETLSVMVEPNQEDVLILSHNQAGGPPVYQDRLRHRLAAVTSMALSADERLLVTGSIDGFVRIWDTHTGQEIHAYEHASDLLITYVSADFSPDGRYVVSWDNNGDRRVMSVHSMESDLFRTACRLLPFEDGHRLLSVADDATDTSEDDPCVGVELGPRWSLVLSILGGG